MSDESDQRLAMPNQETTAAGQDDAARAPRLWWIILVQGVLAILFGVIALIFPIRTAVLLAIIVGAWALADGVIDLVVALRHRRSSPMALRIMGGISSLVFGVVVLAWPGMTLAVLVWVLACWAAVVGLVKIVASVRARAQRGPGWIWGIVRGALWLLLAIVVVFVPAVGIDALIWTLGFWAILSGVVVIFFGVQLRHAASDALASFA